MIYLISKTWEVFAESSEHVKNARQTKKKNKVRALKKIKTD